MEAIDIRHPTAAPTLAAAAALLIIASGLAGCLASQPTTPAAEAPGATGAPGEAAAPSFHAPVNVSTVREGAEPVIATASDGTLFYQGVGDLLNNTVWRSTDGGATWEDVTPPATGRPLSGDAFVAVGNDDTVYVANAFALTLQVWRSDDLGDTWVPLAPPPVTAPMHRMWIVPVGGETVHMAVESLNGPRLWYMRSGDKGVTWTPPVVVDEATHMGSDLAVGPGGALYMVRLDDQWSQAGAPLADAAPGARGAACARAVESGWYLLVSEDDGATWTKRDMWGSGGANCQRLGSSWHSLEVDAHGTLYFVWSWQQGDTARVHLAASRDGGETWTPPRPVAPRGGAQALPWADVRAPGELGVVWYGTGAEGAPEDADAPWFVDYALVTGADTANFTAHVTRVTPRPVHEGNVCPEGPSCSGGEDRSLLDYTWVDFGPEGRAHLAFAATTVDGARALPVYAGEAGAFPAP